MLIRTMQSHELSTLVGIDIETIKATHAGLVSEQFLQTVSEESTLRRLEVIFNHQEHHPFGYVCTDHGTMIGFAVTADFALQRRRLVFYSDTR